MFIPFVPVFVEIPIENDVKVIQLMPVRETNTTHNTKKSTQKSTSGDKSLAQEEVLEEKDYSKDGVKKPIAHSIGMANVPVLDQGQYGTCVTFSATSAINAVYNIGDRIDQQCTLALNKTLGGDYWYGAYYPSQIIDPLNKYGIINKNSCFGFKYPYPNQKVNIRKYKANSYGINIKYQYVNKPDLAFLKSSIDSKRRVLIGFNLGAYGSSTGVIGYNANKESSHGGLWACTQPLVNNDNNCINPTGAHEVIVIGYDDDQRLLQIRNSWGTSLGDSGDFYMTYEFFERQVIDMTSVYGGGGGLN